MSMWPLEPKEVTMGFDMRSSWEKTKESEARQLTKKRTKTCLRVEMRVHGYTIEQ